MLNELDSMHDGWTYRAGNISRVLVYLYPSLLGDCGEFTEISHRRLVAAVDISIRGYIFCGLRTYRTVMCIGSLRNTLIKGTRTWFREGIPSIED